MYFFFISVVYPPRFALVYKVELYQDYCGDVYDSLYSERMWLGCKQAAASMVY